MKAATHVDGRSKNSPSVPRNRDELAGGAVAEPRCTVQLPSFTLGGRWSSETYRRMILHAYPEAGGSLLY